MKKTNFTHISLLAVTAATAIAGCRADTTHGVQLDIIDAQTSESALRIETRDRVVTCLFDPKGILQKKVGDENGMGDYVSWHAAEIQEGEKVGMLFSKRNESVRLIEGTSMPTDTAARFEHWTKAYKIRANIITRENPTKWIGNCESGWNQDFEVVAAI